MELVRGGKAQLVTDDNKEEYLRKMVKYHTIGRMGLAAKVVREGLDAVVSPMVVDLFSEQDLCVLLQGTSRIDVADWESHTEYNNCGKARPHYWLALASYSGDGCSGTSPATFLLYGKLSPARRRVR